MNPLHGLETQLGEFLQAQADLFTRSNPVPVHPLRKAFFLHPLTPKVAL